MRKRWGGPSLTLALFLWTDVDCFGNAFGMLLECSRSASGVLWNALGVLLECCWNAFGVLWECTSTDDKS